MLPLALSAALACASLPGLAAEAAHAEPGWILAQLRQPVPARTAFLELRGSRLLKTPLRLAGEYRRPDAATLVREVRSPYVETTTIRAGEVTIARAGKPPRTFSLTRSPELAGLQASFGALLSGDRALLERHYRLASDGTRSRWTLTLAPRDAQLAAKVHDIVLYGRGDELRCIETEPVRGDAQRTLLAGAATAAGNSTDADALAALCHDRTQR